jgi:hypothetical protein
MFGAADFDRYDEKDETECSFTDDHRVGNRGVLSAADTTIFGIPQFCG